MSVGALGRYETTNPYLYQAAVMSPSRTEGMPPVTAVPAVDPVQNGSRAKVYVQNANPLVSQMPEIRQGADPVEMAVRGRIQYLSEEDITKLINEAGTDKTLPGSKTAAAGTEEALSPAEVIAEAECQTCANRKYQDGSDDPGVSFKTPTKIDPDKAASAVRGHEMEHVVREQDKAEREDRKVVQQSVTLHSDICPECGKVYISGGTTRTVTKADNSEEQAPAAAAQSQQASPAFEAVA